MCDAMKQRGAPGALLTKCQHAHSISPSPLSLCLLFSDLHHHYCSSVWLLQGEWGVLPIVFPSLRIITKCIFVWDNERNITNKALLPTVVPSSQEETNNTAKPCALLSLCSRILIYGCRVLPACPCPPATQTQRCLGVNVGQGDAGLRGTKAAEVDGWMEGRESSLLSRLKSPTTSDRTPSRARAYVYILIRSNVCLLGRQSGRLSVLLFLHPSFISH